MSFMSTLSEMMDLEAIAMEECTLLFSVRQEIKTSLDCSLWALPFRLLKSSTLMATVSLS